MGMFDNLFKTALDKGKKVIKDVTEQTENTIKTTIENIVNNEDVIKSNPYVISEDKAQNKEKDIPKEENIPVENLYDDTDLTVSTLEQEIASKLNEVTDILDVSSNKDANGNGNDNATNFVDSINHTESDTNEEINKMINNSVNTSSTDNNGDNVTKYDEELKDKLQEVVDNYKNNQE